MERIKRGTKPGTVKKQRVAYTEIGDFIKERLILLNITIENFSSMLGVTNVYINNLLQGKRHFPEKYKDVIKDKLFFTEKEKDRLEDLYEREELRWRRLKIAGKKRLNKTAEIVNKENIAKNAIIRLLETVKEEEDFCKRNKRSTTIDELSDYKQRLIKLIIEY